MNRLELLGEVLRDFAAWVVVMTRRFPLGAWFVHVSLFCFVSYWLLDRPVALYFKGHLAGAGEGFFKTVTDLGEGGFWLIPSALAWIFFRWRLAQADYHDVEQRFRRYGHATGYFFLTVLASGLFVNLVKVIIGRIRPRNFFEQGLYGFEPFSTHWAMNSFPSGHSQAAFAAMMALVFIIPRYDVLWLLIAVLVAASRVVTSVHYLSDAAMGSYVGIVGAVLMRRAFALKGIDVRLRFKRDRMLAE